MVDYSQIIRNYISSGNYVLESVEGRINTLWVEGKLSDEERAELLSLAADHAKDVFQTDVLERLAKVEQDIYELKYPVDQFPIWQTGQTSIKGQVYRYDVTGDGELDLCQYNGGRASTSLSIGKIEGWNMLDRELNIVATITRDADGGYVVTPIPEPEPEEGPENPEPEQEPTDGGQGASEAVSGPYDGMTKAQLLEIAQQMGVEAYESWTKAQIIAALTGVE